MSARIAIGYRPEAGSATCRRASAPAAPARTADGGSGGQLPGDLACDQGGRGQMSAEAAEQGHREHRRRVVKPRFPFQRAGQPGRKRQLAQHREHRGGVGRREHRAEQQGLPPAQIQQPARRQRDREHAHQHPDRGQAQRRRSRGAGMSPAGRQPALGQDQHQRAEPQRLRQRGIIEPDTNARLPQSQPQAQEKEQSRQADSVRYPGRHDRREHHYGADQQDETKINGRHGRLRIVRSRASRWWLPVSPISGHQQCDQRCSGSSR
jgi:hypothetical protein